MYTHTNSNFKLFTLILNIKKKRSLEFKIMTAYLLYMPTKSTYPYYMSLPSYGTVSKLIKTATPLES